MERGRHSYYWNLAPLELGVLVLIWFCWTVAALIWFCCWWGASPLGFTATCRRFLYILTPFILGWARSSVEPCFHDLPSVLAFPFQHHYSVSRWSYSLLSLSPIPSTLHCQTDLKACLMGLCLFSIPRGCPSLPEMQSSADYACAQAFSSPTLHSPNGPLVYLPPCFPPESSSITLPLWGKER